MARVNIYGRNLDEVRLDGMARRAARRAGLCAKKTRWRAGSVDNHGGYILLEEEQNYVVAGARFDLSAEEVIKFCTERTPNPHPILTPPPKP